MKEHIPMEMVNLRYMNTVIMFELWFFGVTARHRHLYVTKDSVGCRVSGRVKTMRIPDALEAR